MAVHLATTVVVLSLQESPLLEGAERKQDKSPQAHLLSLQRNRTECHRGWSERSLSISWLVSLVSHLPTQRVLADVNTAQKRRHETPQERKRQL